MLHFFNGSLGVETVVLLVGNIGALDGGDDLGTTTIEDELTALVLASALARASALYASQPCNTVPTKDATVRPMTNHCVHPFRFSNASIYF
jgi:hypothetical protein